MVEQRKMLRLLRKMIDYNKNATTARLKKDEEIEFYYLHRYCKYFCSIKNLDEFKERVKKDNGIMLQVKENMDQYERLQNKLLQRYKEKKAKTKLVVPVNKANEKKSANGIVPDKPPAVDKTPSVKKTTIEPIELFKLLNRPSTTTFLILDCRPQADFEESHILEACVINVPEEKVGKGFSAVKVGTILPQSALGFWAYRTMVDLLILLDWSSREETLKPNSTIYYVRDAILQWDPNNSYKSLPLILQGGYEAFSNSYPHFVSNHTPRFHKTNHTNKMIMPDIFDYPISCLEQERVEVHKPPDISKSTIRTYSKKVPVIEKPVEENSTSPPPPNPPEVPEEVATTSENIAKPVSVEVDQQPSTPERPPPQDSPKITKPKEPLHSGEPHIIEQPPTLTNNQPRPTIDEKTLKDLRKLKPAPEPKVHGSPLKSISKETTDGSYSASLKSEGSGRGILKRASSSPNITQMKDEALFKERPVINRETKPSSTRESYSERIDATYGQTTNGLTGLKNFANNCYMNSIIQCLSNTEALVKDLIHLNKPSINRNSKTKGRVAQEVINTLRCMWSGDIRVNSIKPLKALMGDIKDIFKGAAQQDSNEFLMILLEHLHDDLNIPCESNIIDGADVESGEKSWGEFKRKNCSVIQRLFYGQQRSTVTCSSCCHNSVTFEPFFNLFVPLPNSNTTVTLNDCIQLYMSGERISGWKCPKCEVERNATKKFDISRLPPILIIALKRFSQANDSWLHKKENTVVYPLDGLEMQQFTVKDSEQRYTKYNLYAMSTHIGTLGSGHYRAICKNYLTQKWYMFDDQSVDLLPPSSVKDNSEVYILFYSAVK